MNLRKLILINNACYKAGRTITQRAYVHSLGQQSHSIRYVGLTTDCSEKISTVTTEPETRRPQVCVHGFIGKLADGSIATYQTLPWNHRGWHAGGAANDTHIGFEICEDGLTDTSYFNAVYKEAVELCVYLCKQYGLTEKDII